jgi:hypothetical protein
MIQASCSSYWATLAQARKKEGRGERANVFNRDGITLGVIKRDSNQEKHCQQRDSHDKVSQHLLSMPLRLGRLDHYGALYGLAHVGIIRALYICHHWNWHMGNLLSYCRILVLLQ